MTTSYYPAPKRDRRGAVLIIALVVLLIVGFIACAGIVAGSMAPDGGGPVPTFVTPSTTRPATTPATTKPTVTDPAARAGAVTVHEVKGDDTVHVGEDVPAGTYRAVEAVEPGSFCYWIKSRDSEGDQIIDNGVPTGGRPQVVLKTGQWFTSQGCPNWRRR